MSYAVPYKIIASSEFYIQVAELWYSTDIRSRTFQAAVPQTPDVDQLD
jgi:hypothetical protein